jgi:hypothetical protein
MKVKGQALFFLLLWLPLLLLVSGLIVRTGTLLLKHSKLQSHCDKKILDTLMWQGRGLEQLGKLNPYARVTIQARRTIDALIVAGVVAPPVLPTLIRTRLTLLKTQKVISGMQNTIKVSNLEKAIVTAHAPVPSDFSSKIIEATSPTPILHVKRESGFENEIGAPLELDSDFSKRQSASLTLKIFTEMFLEKWASFDREKDMKLICRGHIQMKSLEAQWSAVLL